MKFIATTEIDQYVERREDWTRLPERPLVSVALSTYDHKLFIRQCIESVLAQKTSFDYEIIIKDDKSTDGTREIVEGYQKYHSERFRLWLCRENLWKRVAIGPHVLAACRGKYIALLEGDDYWTDPMKLQKQVDFLEANPDYAGSFHDTAIMIEGGDQARLWRDCSGCDYCLSDTISASALCHTSSFVCRRSAIIVMPKWVTGVTSGDMAFFMLAAMTGPLRRIPEVMSVYRKHAGGITARRKYLGIYFDARRLYMQLCFKSHLRGREKAKSLEVIAVHARAVIGGRKSLIERLVRIGKAYVAEPRLLLHSFSYSIFFKLLFGMELR